MGLTFIFSMFMSNTATTVMMLAVITPVVVNLEKDDPIIKGMMLAIPFAANLGGMGTIIGSPPNAIAAGAIANIYPINFAEWMLVGLPPAIFLGTIAWIYIIKKYPSQEEKIDLSELLDDSYQSAILPLWKKILVMLVFILTILLWLTTPLHGISTPVISFIPITIFASVRVIGVSDIRQLPWDVLLLLTGGLSLGLAVSKTGLAEWLVGGIPLSSGIVILIAFVFSYIATIISNFMSNTAASNILVPIGLAAAVGFEPQVVIPIALGASAAMCMPISTPPNALAYASEKLAIKDFISGGVVIGVIAPIVSVIWCIIVFNNWL
jgi:sodium-dependent dicarboxylate transporter 2/3/5